MDLRGFASPNMFQALKGFFEQLNIPVNYISEEPVSPEGIIPNSYSKEKMPYGLMKEVYFLGMVDDAAFEGNKSLDVEKIKSDYDGILIFGVTLTKRVDGLLPTRTHLADITRAFNREFHYTPVVVIFKYEDSKGESLITFSNAERLAYKQEWREGEKAGKVSMLKDININKPHTGHIHILRELAIKRTGNKKIESFDALYKYWQEVFSVSVLNKAFYRELSNWYFWAIKEVKFPNPPLRRDYASNEKHDDAIKEHKGKNVIRLLTRILFVWFIKEKGLIPKDLFNANYLRKNLLNELAPEKEVGLFHQDDLNSFYYKAILQNLFFAALNQEQGKRAFKKKGNYNVTNLMRYERFFKNSELFLELIERDVPFMNGGLFECLDKPHPTEKGPKGGDVIIRNDGFSDREDNVLQVPDFLFFDSDEEVDLSEDYGSKNKLYKKAKTRGLIKILDSYKFTITENTPIEQEIALDPELLGKVFENLLASYNPETKTTARKQTGSFYTPREIVDYMVDESLIAYLKTELLSGQHSDSAEEALDKNLHTLFAFDAKNPFSNDSDITTKIIAAIDKCKILDPACGSGAFPMGALQKMVHVLNKLDPKNERWQQRQIEKVEVAIEAIEKIDDSNIRKKIKKELKEQIEDIQKAFSNNELDYGRKLFLIENCIYGVDIQPIAVQISKLRFFISLIVDQTVSKEKTNFGIRPLPNLETKFVAANTLVGLERPKQGTLQNPKIENIEKALQKNNQKIFSLKTPSRKRELREESEDLRKKLVQVLIDSQWSPEVASKIASWQPFDQNTSASFFDAEWMFGNKYGFDVVIGNPPYHQLSKDQTAKKEFKNYLKRKYKTSGGRLNLYIFFLHEAIRLSKKGKGIVSYIIPNTLLTQEYYKETRELLLKECSLYKLVDYEEMPFENAVVENITLVIRNCLPTSNTEVVALKDNLERQTIIGKFKHSYFLAQKNYSFSIYSDEIVDKIFSSNDFTPLKDFCEINQGIALKGDKSLSLRNENDNGEYLKLLDGRNINKYSINWTGVYLDYDLNRIHSCKRKDIFESEEKLFFRRVSKELIFTYDNEQFFALNTLIVVNIKANVNIKLKFILALMNSALMNYLYQKKFKSTKKVFSEIQTRSVKELPIVTPSEIEKTTLVYLSEIILFINKIDFLIIKKSIFTNVIDGIVFQLYFPDHLKENKIDILDFVCQDLEHVLKTPFIENLKEKKVEIIEELYEKWTNPDNEVRNRIKLFSVRSPEILKLILENN